MQEAASPAVTKLPLKKTHLWKLAIVTYVLVILMTAAAIWAYYYMDAKIRRERGLPDNAPSELQPHRRG
jgi:hypothetical protein